MAMVDPVRARADACPGVFATHDAADGALARVRLPGGRLSAAQANVIADCAEDFGDGAVHLTSRGNLQLRGVRGDGLVRRLSGAGLLPSPAHERVRNYLASPGSAWCGRLAAELDAAVCARPELAALPGRFLFALDDGSGDVSAEGADVCWRALGPGTGALLLAGVDTGLRIPATRAVAALVLAAGTFVAVRGDAWRVRESPEAAVALTAAVAGQGEFTAPVDLPASKPVPGDVFPLFGLLSAARLRLLATCSGELVVTPWRSVVLPGAGRRELAGFGLPVVENGISACIGSPGCAKSAADVRSDARRLSATGVRAHFAGCERRCGRPKGEHADVLAVQGGYRVDGVFVPLDRLATTMQVKGRE